MTKANLGRAVATMPPIVSVVARSNTGKTTVLEGLLPALKGAGLRVAVVKHHHHTSSFDTPREGHFSGSPKPERISSWA